VEVVELGGDDRNAFEVGDEVVALLADVGVRAGPGHELTGAALGFAAMTPVEIQCTSVLAG
jgi:hypothetical protein